MDRVGNPCATFNERVSRSISGDMRIAAGPSAAGFLLPRYLKQFREQYPGVRLSVRNVFSRDALRLLRRHEVDFAVGALDTALDDIQCHKMLTSKIMLATPESHPLAEHETVSAKETERYPMIAPPRGTYTRYLWQLYARGAGVELNPSMEVGWWILKRYVQSGLGISVLPSLCVGEGERISLVQFARPFPDVPYGVFTHRDRLLSAAAGEFILMMVPDGSATT